MTSFSALHIVHVILSSGFAGSERSTSESCNQQVVNNRVTLIVSKKHRKNGKSILDHISPEVEVVYVDRRFWGKWQLNSVIQLIKPDVIHCHLRRATRYVASIKTQAKSCSTLHIEVNGKEFLKMDGLICNALWQVQQVPSSYLGRVFKANNSLVPQAPLAEEQLKAIRSSLAIADDHIMIGAVGRYHTSKAWDTLIESFKGIDSPNARLLFFGAGKDEALLKQLAKDDARIQFIGFRDDIKHVYQAMDICACPSRYEPLPRVMLEAMDAGTPVIASDTGGCKELIDTYGGTMFETDNVDDLRNKLGALIQQIPIRHKPDLSAHFVENASKAMETFYRELVGTPNAPSSD